MEINSALENFEKEQETDYEDATHMQRLANFILDYIFKLILSVILGGLLGLIIGIVAPEKVNILLQERNFLINYLIGSVALIIYYTAFEATTGKTLGKYITKTKVVTEEGEKPDFGTILLRSLSRIVPFNAFSFLGGEPTGWHDKWSQTKVVKIKK